MRGVINVSPGEEQEVRRDFAAALQRNLILKRVLFGVGAIATLAVILPLAIAALQAGLALAAIGFLALCGVAAWKMVPRLLLTIENRERERTQAEMNRHLAALKNEAKKNPIEQAQVEYLRRQQQYQTFKTAMETIGGSLRSITTSLDRKKKEKPNYDLSQETEALAKMQTFYDNRIERLKVAYAMLGRFKDKIEEAQTKWEFQLAANDAIRAMNATDKDAKIAEILTEVAFGSVQKEFDSVFARLDVDAAEISSASMLTFGGGLTLDTSAITINQPEAVRVTAQSNMR